MKRIEWQSKPSPEGSLVAEALKRFDAILDAEKDAVSFLRKNWEALGLSREAKESLSRDTAIYYLHHASNERIFVDTPLEGSKGEL